VSRPGGEAGPPRDGDGGAETGPAEQSRSGNPVPEPSVASMFDSIAPVYDRMNTVMTAGLDGGWRRAAVRAARLSAGSTALDVACGTGKLTLELARIVGPSGRVVGVDLAAGMLDEARLACAGYGQVELRRANALALPFEDRSFDAATIAFGLRNLSSFEAGLREMARVVKPGGRVVCLELTQPRPRWMVGAYLASFRVVAPALGRLHGRRRAYEYLPRSLEGFPTAAELAETMRRVGLRNVRVRRLGLGTVALHAAEVGESPAREG
jgi:demethylmenaquinone methyltransferase/2-methoxy-6-polyprenyl-1,4-benzoquinol methylase